jgi:DNA-binding LytR/AlgR family response regulator
MARIKIGMVEDEMVIALTIEKTLEELGYEFCGPASTYGDALEMLEVEKPDLVLLDINLAGKKDGIDVAEKIKLLYQIPFIFLTANSDTATIERAKKVKPNAYLVKPFNKEELYATIEIAISNFQSTNNASTDNIKETFVFVKEGQQYRKVYFDEVLYIESDNNYTRIYFQDNKKIMVRSSFTEFLEGLPVHEFIRVHRSYAVSISKIASLEIDDVVIQGHKIPVSKSYRDIVKKALGIKDS